MLKFFAAGFLVLLTAASNAQTSEGLRDQDLRAYLQTDACVAAGRRCERSCQDTDKPRLCYYNITVEEYHVLGAACGRCPLVQADCSLPQCVTADGFERGLITANRKLPGPSVQVCAGDRIVMDVLNTMPGRTTTVHFHGILQQGSNAMDGVPMVTQCPIGEGATFRYDFIAGNAGTHFWHSHDGFQKMDGLQGHLIVRMPKSRDPNAALYDEDLPEHVLLLTDWFEEGADQKFPGLRIRQPGQEPVSYLINGRGRLPSLAVSKLPGGSEASTRKKKPVNTSSASYRAAMLAIYARYVFECPRTTRFTPHGRWPDHEVPLTTFHVTAGRRYRFRLIGGTCAHCPAEVAISQHKMRIIATDGNAVKSVDVDKLIVLPGERYDFVLDARQPRSTYWIVVRGLGPCTAVRTFGLAALYYVDVAHPLSLDLQPSYDEPLTTLKRTVTLNPVDAQCGNGNRNLCVDQLKLADPFEKRLTAQEPDLRLYFEFDFEDYTDDANFFREGIFHRFMQPVVFGPVAAYMNNASNVLAASPLLGQFGDISPEQFCPETGCQAGFCECLHLVKIPLGGLVEMAVVDGALVVGDLHHPFHLHGHKFHVLALNTFPATLDNASRRSAVANATAAALRSRRSGKPWFPAKDTVAVPSAGYSVVRFIADNPGFWMFHCHFIYHQVVGMSLILQVGEPEDFPPVPPGFPTCGNFVRRVDTSSYA